MADSLAALGMETGRRGRVRAEGPILMEPAEDAEAWLAGAEERDFKGRRVFFLPSPFPGDQKEGTDSGRSCAGRIPGR